MDRQDGTPVGFQIGQAVIFAFAGAGREYQQVEQPRIAAACVNHRLFLVAGEGGEVHKRPHLVRKIDVPLAGQLHLIVAAAKASYPREGDAVKEIARQLGIAADGR